MWPVQWLSSRTPLRYYQVKTVSTDGYNAVQIAYGERKEKNTPAALKGHFKKANTTPKSKVAELRTDNEPAVQLGEVVTVDIFAEGEFVDVIGSTKGKGFRVL